MEKNKLGVNIFKDDYGYICEWMWDINNNFIWATNGINQFVYSRRINGLNLFGIFLHKYEKK